MFRALERHDRLGRWKRARSTSSTAATICASCLPRVYGMRADTESLNAQFERAFYNRRLPAWGLHNQTVIVLMAALAQNAWARHTWQRAIDRQQSPPQIAA